MLQTSLWLMGDAFGQKAKEKPGCCGGFEECSLPTSIKGKTKFSGRLTPQAIPGQRGWPSEKFQPWKVQEEEWRKHKCDPWSKATGRQVLTRNSRLCVVNTMCTNFNQFCQAYPCFNTPSHTNRSLKSVDKPDGLEHKKSKSGSEALPLCSQLGTGYPRPMGLAGNHWLPTRAYPNPTPGGTNSGDTYHAHKRSK